MYDDIKESRIIFARGCAIIKWEVRDLGKGNIMLYEKDGKTYLDTEGYGQEFAKYILSSIIDKAILSDTD